MQQIWWGGGVFYQSEEYTCMLHIYLLRAHFLSIVKYWYEIRDVLVPIFHGVKFVKCENLRFDMAYTRRLQTLWSMPEDGARGKNLDYFRSSFYHLFLFVIESFLFEQQVLFRTDFLSVTWDLRSKSWTS